MNDMALTWRDYVRSVVYVTGILALMYVALITSSPDLVWAPPTTMELPTAPS